MESFMSQLLTKQWADILDREEFIRIINKADTLYSTTTVYPEKKKVFSIFKKLQLEDIKVVILGQDPYPGLCTKNIFGTTIPSEPYAQGIAFSVKEYMKPPKTLQIILDSISKQFYENMEIPAASPCLDRWINQGIFLINTALTVEANKPNSHKDLWGPFIRDFLLKLSNRNPNIIYLLWGKDAQAYQQYITTGYVLKDIHPNAVSYNSKLEFKGCFKECNSLLKTKIQW